MSPLPPILPLSLLQDANTPPQLHLNEKSTGDARMKTELGGKTHHRSKTKGLPLRLWCPVSIINPVSKSAVPR